MNAPLPVAKGVAEEISTGKRVTAYFLKHDPNAGETVADDCYITISKTLDVGAKGSGESGLYPPAEFRQQFKFIEAK